MKIQQTKCKYLQVKEQILREILERKLEIGNQLPPEGELAGMFHVGRNTVRTALDSLASDGIITKQTGHPCVIRKSPVLEKPAPREVIWVSAGPGASENNLVYFEIFRAAAEEAVRRNLKLHLIICKSRPALNNFLVHAKNYAGVIFNSSMSNEDGFNDAVIRAFPDHLALLYHIEHTLPSRVIINDDRKGTQFAIEHLISQGHKKILFLGILPRFYQITPFMDRLKSYEETMKSAGLAPHVLISESLQDFNNPEKILKKNRKMLNEMDSIFIVSDPLAIAVMSALEALGIRVPEDLSIMTFDGILQSQFTCPPLTSMRHPFEKIASALFDHILDDPENPLEQDRIIRIEPEFLPGASVKNRNETTSEVL
jgi:Transcriptional regulators